MENESVGNDGKNDVTPVEETMVHALPSLDGSYCCWGDECQFIGVPGPTLN
jgi:hypothetical protein